MFGVDIAIVIHIQTAVCLSVSGRGDDSEAELQKADAWANQLNHSHSKEFLSLTRFIYLFWNQKKRSILEAQKFISSAEGHLKMVAKQYFGLILLEHSKSKEDQDAGFSLAISAYNELLSYFGINTDLMNCSAYLTAYVKYGDYERGLVKAEEVIQRAQTTGIFGLHGVYAIQDFKAQLLCLKMKAEQDWSHTDEVASLYYDAIQFTEERGMKGRQLRYLLHLGQLWKLVDNQPAFEEVKEKIDIILKELKPLNKTRADQTKEIEEYFHNFTI